MGNIPGGAEESGEGNIPGGGFLFTFFQMTKTCRTHAHDHKDSHVTKSLQSCDHKDSHVTKSLQSCDHKDSHVTKSLQSCDQDYAVM